jgi:cob(I)alamin adenosyltransferase
MTTPIFPKNPCLTSISNGKTLRKDHDIIELLGTIDELSCFIGMCKNNNLNTVQQMLQQIASIISKMWEQNNDTSIVNEFINKIQTEIPCMSDFVLCDNMFHVCRAVCRRAERRIVSVFYGMPKYACLVTFFNELSKYLFKIAIDFSIKNE